MMDNCEADFAHQMEFLGEAAGIKELDPLSGKYLVLAKRRTGMATLWSN
jgi:hypothetical protein